MDFERASDRRPKKLVIVFALLMVAMGVFYILLGIGIVAPDRARLAAEPLWFRIAFGLAFVLGGTAAIIQMVAGSGNTTTGELRATVPAWLRSFYGALCFAIAALLAAMFSWVAFGPGEREFTGSGAFTGEIGGRIAFGLGAILTWLVLAVIGFIKVRGMLFRR